jgi:uncharacterized coiled-coil DUF342 family protein
MLEWLLLFGLVVSWLWSVSVLLTLQRERKELQEQVDSARAAESNCERMRCQTCVSLELCRKELAKAERSLDLMRHDLEQYKDAALDFERLAGERAEEIRELSQRVDQGRRALG